MRENEAKDVLLRRFVELGVLTPESARRIRGEEFRPTLEEFRGNVAMYDAGVEVELHEFPAEAPREIPALLAWCRSTISYREPEWHSQCGAQGSVCFRAKRIRW